jgi:predicted chitinase
MTELKKGSRGDAVALMQGCLCRTGFDTKGIDGHFGHGTEQSLRRFQKHKNLPVSGVCTADSRIALRMEEDDPLRAPAPVIASITVDKVRDMFPAQTRRSSIATYLQPVLDALGNAGLDDRDMVVMALATIRAETEGFEPIEEWGDGAAYEGRKDLGNLHNGDGARFKGRGFIQLTGRANYAKYGMVVGSPLEDQPNLANDPKIAAALLALYLRDRHALVKYAIFGGDLKQARKLVNGGSHGFDRFKDTFDKGVQILAG